MKVRTEARREAIVREATRLFLEMGYERATMSELAQRVGGSKATLYGYFPSKEELFAAVTEATGETHLAEAVAELDALPHVGLEAGLIRFAEKLLSLIVKEEAQALQRMIVGESGRSNVGEVFMQRGPRRCIEAVCAALQAAMDRGDLQPGPAPILTLQLLGLVRAEVELRQYLQHPPRLTRKQLGEMAGRAVRVFLGGYRASAPPV
ncbi:TetR/AcrR family transcriptional regulator [Aquincola tertiaricarbonis]|uniref:TetR/AcrR family transcriptional regulator n=1 Tax=Aquincola tertiaricarbonis TaxID=391953 RepID=A0ABY4S958_AQUTE|nr:TetR/AcrR family transcriptional regulator [Aquincola tertiaricarbonis]URI07611.1 TetR/AcrR family transcriptional regulator [Aquincola tertiaricarbonis]